jgi:hypothetical protein
MSWTKSFAPVAAARYVYAIYILYAHSLLDTMLCLQILLHIAGIFYEFDKSKHHVQLLNQDMHFERALH